MGRSSASSTTSAAWPAPCPPTATSTRTGLAVVQRSAGKLVAGHVLVSNFNDKANVQGTGTTIVQISPAGHVSLFAHLTAGTLRRPCPGGVGLTTALPCSGLAG